MFSSCWGFKDNLFFKEIFCAVLSVNVLKVTLTYTSEFVVQILSENLLPAVQKTEPCSRKRKQTDLSSDSFSLQSADMSEQKTPPQNSWWAANHMNTARAHQRSPGSCWCFPSSRRFREMEPKSLRSQEWTVSHSSLHLDPALLSTSGRTVNQFLFSRTILASGDYENKII